MTSDDDAADQDVVESDVATEAGARETAPSSTSTATPGPVTVEEMVAALKGKIDRLGPVNMMAIEEFDDLDERYEFLTTQRDDLVESIRATGDAITRINRTSWRTVPATRSPQSTRTFQETFSTLFGGGRAGLVLLDESDLLESGIDIIAQPPG